MAVHMMEQTEVFKSDYPFIKKFTDDQLNVFWTAHEIQVEKDVHDVLTNLTEAERHGVFTVLKLFTLYEVKAGADYWTTKFMNTFKHHEFQAMASVFGMFELAVHKPFYNKINELLNATDESFYTNYHKDAVLSERMQTINSIVDNDDVLVSTGAFTLVEGAILYSSFAFLKHFQSLGKNKLMNVVRGINFSVRDENLHAIAGAWTFNELKRQMEVSLTPAQENQIQHVAKLLYQEECAIIREIFSKGEIEGIDIINMTQFVGHRINHCLQALGMAPLVGYTEDNNISPWFYKGINNYQFNDFFSGQGREYSRNWDEDRFVW